MTNRNILPFSSKSEIQEDASRWVIKLDSGKVSTEQLAELRLWLSQSPTHRSQFTSQLKLWGDLDDLEELGDIIQRDHAVEQRKTETLPIKAIGRYLTAACLLLACFTGLLYFSVIPPWLSELDPNNQVYVTAKGGQQTVSLPDGSIVKLNTDTRLKLDFTERTRRIHLVRGEAHFKVAHNPDRPFIVHVADGSVRAVGTAFNVRYQGEKVDVIVTEGIVEVAPQALPPLLSTKAGKEEKSSGVQDPIKIAVAAGHEVSFDEQAVHAIAMATPESVERKLAWHDGMLQFDGEPLVDAIAEVSRYTDIKIIIANAELKNLPVGGYFKVGEVESMLKVFEQTFDIKVTRKGNSLVYLSKLSTPPHG
jgi:transmembrane sensor